MVALRQASQDEARRGAELLSERRFAKRILFGDLHVHTTYSIDAFVYGLSFFGGGGGSRPPADACDFARYCSQIDFFSLNDHAEGLLPDRWRRSIESVRQCNALAGDPEDPDLVAYMGFEWTQRGTTPQDHFGHKNVIFPGLGDEELPTRPITALPHDTMGQAPPGWGLLLGRGAARLVGRSYADFLWWIQQLAELPDCESGVDVRELPARCRENAPTPEELFEKLDQWGFERLVIPHGLAWGVHAPPGTGLELQLRGSRHAPEVQRLVEVYSGHGAGEVYRDLPEHETDERGARVCPEPSADYLPCCWRAGEIARERCGELPEAECQARVEEAQQRALAASVDPHLVFADTRPEDWLDCDQCRDCFKPAHNYRPGMSAQYALALANPEERDAEGRPLRFRWGFIGSSDDHKAQPGTGYKQLARKRFTDARGVAGPQLDAWSREWIFGEQQDPGRARRIEANPRSFRDLFDVERVSSFYYPGGLVAVHAGGRDRRSIWEALERREVYGTSGPRLLLWFDLLNGPEGPVPMGGEVELDRNPRFEVRAVGSFQQQPGCPDHAQRGLSPERLEALCLGECYHPGDRRHAIAAVEIVRIRPQRSPDEPVASLVEDPWLRHDCEPGPTCVFGFEDAEFSGSGRDALYYARVLQEETPAVNGAQLRTEFDAQGRAVSVSPCHGSYRTDPDDDCLAPVQERAWSSPIFVDQRR